MNVDREVDFPDEKIFFPVGYNVKKPDDGDKGNKHYRRYYSKPLENVLDPNGNPLVVSPFLSEQITRCEKAKKKKGGLLGGLFGGSGDPAEDEGPEFEVIPVGKFKGMLKVFNEDAYNKRKEIIYDQVLKLQILFKECYNLEFDIHKGTELEKVWPEDLLDRLHPEKIESY